MWDKKYPPVAPRTHFLRFFRFRHIDPPSGVSVRHEPGSRVRKECTARRHTQKGQITHTQDNDGSHTSHGVSLYIMSWRAHGQLVLPLVWRSRPPQPLIPPRQASPNLICPNIAVGVGNDVGVGDAGGPHGWMLSFVSSVRTRVPSSPAPTKSALLLLTTIMVLPSAILICATLT